MCFIYYTLTLSKGSGARNDPERISIGILPAAIWTDPEFRIRNLDRKLELGTFCVTVRAQD